MIKEGLRMSFGVPGRLPREVPNPGATFNGYFIPAGVRFASSSSTPLYPACSNNTDNLLVYSRNVHMGPPPRPNLLPQSQEVRSKQMARSQRSTKNRQSFCALQQGDERMCWDAVSFPFPFNIT